MGVRSSCHHNMEKLLGRIVSINDQGQQMNGKIQTLSHLKKSMENDLHTAQNSTLDQSLGLVQQQPGSKVKLEGGEVLTIEALDCATSLK